MSEPTTKSSKLTSASFFQLLELEKDDVQKEADRELINHLSAHALIEGSASYELGLFFRISEDTLSALIHELFSDPSGNPDGVVLSNHAQDAFCFVLRHKSQIQTGIREWFLYHRKIQLTELETYTFWGSLLVWLLGDEAHRWVHDVLLVKKEDDSFMQHIKADKTPFSPSESALYWLNCFTYAISGDLSAHIQIFRSQPVEWPLSYHLSR